MFTENPLLSYPYLVKKTSILSKLHYIVSAKKVNKMSFFSLTIFHEKMTAAMAIFCQKHLNSLKKTLLSFSYFVKIRKFSQKHGALMSFFWTFWWKTPCCHAHIWSKNVNSVKTTIYGPKKSMGKKEREFLGTIILTSWKYYILLPTKGLSNSVNLMIQTEVFQSGQSCCHIGYFFLRL